MDEIGELPLEQQSKLLRALEKREVRRVGDSQPRRFDSRIIAATHRDLSAAVNQGRFREDLYFRLAVVRIRLPPLRARREDIPVLIRHFAECFAPGRAELAAPLIATLAGRSFPGNVRELRNAVQRAFTLADPAGETLTPPTEDAEDVVAQTNPLDVPYKEGLRHLVEGYERTYLEHALRVSGGSVSGAARLSGLSRRYVQELMVRHGLRDSDDR